MVSSLLIVLLIKNMIENITLLLYNKISPISLLLGSLKAIQKMSLKDIQAFNDYQKTTGVPIIPVIGKEVDEEVEFGGLLGRAVVMPVIRSSCEMFINRIKRILYMKNSNLLWVVNDF